MRDKLGRFKKGNIPENPIKKGQHCSLQTEFKKGNISPSFWRGKYGKQHPNWKGGKPQCLDCGKEIWYDKTKCQSCYLKSLKQSGNPNWKGGRTRLLQSIRTCYFYKRWRLRILEKQNWNCSRCGRQTEDLEIHHYPKSFPQIIRENKIKDMQSALLCKELWDINNGIALCEICHIDTDNFAKNLKSYKQQQMQMAAAASAKGQPVAR